MAQCRSCGAAIKWVRTEGQKYMPIDEKPVQDGNIVMVGGVAKVISPSQETKSDRFISHFVTCPHANSHRRPS